MISVVIPHYPFNEEINDTLAECVASLNGYDELILVVNDGTGFAKAVNQGMKLAKGDYIFVVNNDIKWQKGELSDLCVPTTVTSPLLNGDPSNFWGCFFCVPRSVYETVGGLDERYGIGFYEDDDYIMTLKKAGIEMKCIESCEIVSEGHKTMDRFNKSELMEKNRKLFNEKWL